MVFVSIFRIRWVDTDVAGVMHFSNYLRYFEACEQEFYDSLGMSLNEILEKHGIMLPRVEAHCEYKAPCRFDDMIEVSVEVREVTSKTVTLDFKMHRKRENKLAAEGYMKCIAVDLRWKVVELPPAVAKILRENTV